MKIKNLASFLLIAIIFAVLAKTIFQNWEVISAFTWRFNVIDSLFLFVFLVPIYLINGTSWFLVLRALREKVNYSQVVRVWFLSNACRFIPGGIWQYGGRVYLSAKLGVATSTSLTALFIESIFVITIGLIISLLAFTFVPLPVDVKLTRVFATVLLILFIFILSLTNQVVVNKIVLILKKIARKKGQIRSFKLSPSWVGLLSISYFLQFAFGGSVLFFLSRQAVDLGLNLLPVFIGIYAASWLIGYLTIIAPAGLGVQEISVATILSFYMPFSVAVMVAIFFRIAFLIIEAVSIVVANVIVMGRPGRKAS